MQKIILPFLLFNALNACCQPTDTNNLLERPVTENWEYHQVNGQLSGKAVVPGTIQTDLLNDGKIQDPFYRTTRRILQWIDKEDWFYTTKLNFTNEELSKRKPGPRF